MSDRRCGTFRDFVLITLVVAFGRAIAYFFAIVWRAYKQSLSLIAGRPLEHCRSMYLTPALGLGLVAWVFILGGVGGFSASRAGPWDSFGAILLGGAMLGSVRLLIRRGSL